MNECLTTLFRNYTGFHFLKTDLITILDKKIRGTEATFLAIYGIINESTGLCLTLVWFFFTPSVVHITYLFSFMFQATGDRNIRIKIYSLKCRDCLHSEIDQNSYYGIRVSSYSRIVIALQIHTSPHCRITFPCQQALTSDEHSYKLK